MNKLILGLIPLIPLFLASPVLIAATVLLLGSPKKPIAKTAVCLSGQIFAIFMIGIVAITISAGARVDNEPSKLSALLDIIIGMLLLAAAVRQFWNKPEAKTKKHASEKDKRVFPYFFFLGILLTITNFSSLMAFLTASKEASDAGIAMVPRISVMAVAGFLFISPMAVPLISAVLAPETTHRMLAVVERFTKRYAKYVLVVILVYYGLKLLLRGINLINS